MVQNNTLINDKNGAKEMPNAKTRLSTKEMLNAKERLKTR